MQALGFDLIWFGIVVVVVIEISLITPPIGLNVFVLNAMLPDIRLTEIFRGVLPFVAADPRPRRADRVHPGALALPAELHGMNSLRV